MSKVKTVLIIDDEISDHIIAKETIEGYDPTIELLSAYDGTEALEMIAQMDKKPEVIFLDINMPRMNGHEFLSEYAKHDEYSSVVIMLTTSDQEIDKQKSMHYDFVKEYIIKPLELGTFDEVIARI